MDAAIKRGITFVQSVLFATIALSLITGGAIFFEQASLASRINDTQRITTSLQSEMRGLFNRDGLLSQMEDGATLTKTVITAGGAPSSAVSGDDLVNPWDGGIAITAENGGREFRITMTNIPDFACARIIPLDKTGSGPAGTGVTRLQITGAAQDHVHTVPEDGAVGPSRAAELCDDATESASERVTVAWNYTR